MKNSLTSIGLAFLRTVDVLGIAVGIVFALGFPHFPEVWISAFAAAGLSDLALARIGRNMHAA